MKLNKNTLQKIAHLARLEFNPKSEDQMIHDMEEILTWVEKLDELDTENVVPLTHVSHEINIYREDKVKGQSERKSALYNAPKKDSEYFRVPKVLE